MAKPAPIDEIDYKALHDTGVAGFKPISPAQIARAKRIEEAASASLVAWDGEEESVRSEHQEVIEELRRALEGDDAKPDRPYDDEG